MKTLHSVSFLELKQRQSLTAPAEALLVAEFAKGALWEPDYHLYAATLDDLVVGAANVRLRRATKEAYVRHLVVDPDHRSHHIGSIMMTNIFDAAKRASCDRMSVMPLSKRNQRFYRRHGFTSPLPDPIVMYKDLG